MTRRWLKPKLCFYDVLHALKYYAATKPNHIHFYNPLPSSHTAITFRSTKEHQLSQHSYSLDAPLPPKMHLPRIKPSGARRLYKPGPVCSKCAVLTLQKWLTYAQPLAGALLPARMNHTTHMNNVSTKPVPRTLLWYRPPIRPSSEQRLYTQTRPVLTPGLLEADAQHIQDI